MQFLCEERDKQFVGAAVYRRRGEANDDAALPVEGNLIFRRVGYGLDAQRHAVSMIPEYHELLGTDGAPYEAWVPSREFSTRFP